MPNPTRTHLSTRVQQLVLGMLLGVGVVSAQPASEALISAPAPGSRPKVYALVSAVGAQMQLVRQRQVVGSNVLDHFTRTQMPVPDQALNYTVLRGVSRAVARVDPQARQVLLKFEAPVLDNVHQSARAQAALDALLSSLQTLEARKDWDEIIAVTPRYAHAGTNQMGDKLWGIGIYVQPLETAQLEGAETPLAMDTTDELLTDGIETARSETFVAPYAYLRFTVLDAKTLKVIRTLDRMDARKTAGKDCDAIDVYKCFSSAQYATMLDTLTERTALRGVGGDERSGSVEMKEPQRVPVAPLAR